MKVQDYLNQINSAKSVLDVYRCENNFICDKEVSFEEYNLLNGKSAIRKAQLAAIEREEARRFGLLWICERRDNE